MAELTTESGNPVDLQLHRVPFFLEPGYCTKPEGWWEAHTTRMVRKFGSQAAFDQVKRSHRLMPRAAEAGLDAEGWSDANLDRRRQSSTLRAHRLVCWIDRTRGWEAAEAAYAVLGAAHFVEGEILDDAAVLTRAAAAAGVNEATAVAFLSSDEGESRVLEVADAVQEMGIHSIPTLLINGELVSSGAAGAAEVLQALRASMAASRPGRRLFEP